MIKPLSIFLILFSLVAIPQDYWHWMDSSTVILCGTTILVLVGMFVGALFQKTVGK